MSQALRVGVAGLGTVGAALISQVAHRREALTARCGRGIEVVAVSARSRGKDRGFDLKKMKWFDDPVALARDASIDVFVELMGGSGGVAKAAVEAALAAGKSVVTANKALLAKHGVKLAALAEKNNVALNYEAAVGAAIPIVKTLREGLAGNEIARIYGILNGTCNYILTRMEQEGLSFADCLKDAQRLGYAEADPTFDIEGHDTAQKLSILASLAFGTKVDESAIYVEGISSIAPADLAAADELGYRVKLLGVAVKTPQGIEQRVHPTMVRKDSAIAQVMGVTNAVTVDASGINPITLIGPGAGGAATASAVLSDIADVARGLRVMPFGRPTAKLASVRKAPMQRHEGGYYIRLQARDKPGTAATIAKRLAQQEISLESIVQRHRKGAPESEVKGGSVPVILITYATSEDAVRKALAAVGRDKVISGRPQVIRIEKN
ncbi:homoserine dehydrogenase [Pseudolabrys taiwanensis]|uniref:Homoserine dehydrogenase n=1 Tax=Pseudolabrys taiwanensis TaxID=331696 RepID=A0A345ZS05_9HYPH|nr:homoserine dehydrogenase [Pseudolabrys taiwanensis]AXK79702.1 homoserine dehydrogenase [Pseudolabrys taiwanensis]